MQRKIQESRESQDLVIISGKCFEEVGKYETGYENNHKTKSFYNW